MAIGGHARLPMDPPYERRSARWRPLVQNLPQLGVGGVGEAGLRCLPDVHVKVHHYVVGKEEGEVLVGSWDGVFIWALFSVGCIGCAALLEGLRRTLMPYGSKGRENSGCCMMWIPCFESMRFGQHDE